MTTKNDSKPLVFFDIESTGTDPSADRIITMAAYKVSPDGNAGTEWFFHPGMPIPPASTRIHGITDAMVEGKPFFEDLAQQVHHAFKGCDLSGYNIRGMDIPMLWEHFCRAGIEWDITSARIIDSSEIFRRKERRDLTAAVKKFCGKEHDAAHDAMADVNAARDVFVGQAHHYADIGAMSRDELHAFCTAEEFEGEPAKRLDLAGHIIQDSKGVARYTLKKVRGKAVVDDPGFGGWMLRNDFPAHTKRVLKGILYPDSGQKDLF